ncbi:MAG: peptidylprolyl isomerase [Pseudolabrys sp.]
MTNSLFAGSPAPRRRAGLLAASLALLMAAAGPLHAQDTKAPAKDPVIAKVNGTEIHQSDIDIAEQEAGKLPPMSATAKKDYLVQFMSDVILGAQAAEAKKIDQTEDFKRKLAFDRQKLLMADLMANVAKDAVTDEALHKTYDDAVKSMGKEEEVHARHILIRAKPGDKKASEAAKKKIEDIIAKLKNGADFAKLAKEDTEDPSGKANGGDLGYFTKKQMVPEFAKVAFSLKKGEISGPVHTQFGWHVIKVEDKRTKPPPKFEDVKDQLVNYLQRKAQAEMIQKLRASAKIEKFYKTADETKPDAAKPDDKKAEPAKK